MMSVEKYVKKPIVIEAVEWTGENHEEIDAFIGTGTRRSFYDMTNNLVIETLEGNHLASVGDYIIKGISGEFYPCKPDIFAKTYDRIEDK